MSKYQVWDEFKIFANLGATKLTELVLMCLFMVQFRPSGPIQGFAKPDMNSPPVHNLPLGYGRSMPRTPQFISQLSPTSLSRLGQPPIQRTNHGRSSGFHGNEGIHMKPQHSSYSYDPGNSNSLGGNSFNNSTPWGMHKLDPGFWIFFQSVLN